MPSEIAMMIEESGALVTDGHFRYTSGRHGRVYLKKENLYTDTAKASRLGRLLADPYYRLAEPVEIVIGPATGGIILSQWTADHLTFLQNKLTLSLFADKDPQEGFKLRWDYRALLFNKRVLIVEDAINSGKSTRSVVQLVRKHGGIVVGVSAIATHGEAGLSDIGNPPRLNVLYEIQRHKTWHQDNCQLCEDEIALEIPR